MMVIDEIAEVWRAIIGEGKDDAGESVTAAKKVVSGEIDLKEVENENSEKWKKIAANVCF
jgi:hypothetical protein